MKRFTTSKEPVQKKVFDIDDYFQEDYDFDADDDDETQQGSDTKDESQKAYDTSCQDQGIPVNKHIRNSLLTTELVVKNQHLAVKDIRALAIAMLINTTVKSLTLIDNGISATGLSKLNQMLPYKTGITELIITDNAIGTNGAKDICHVLMASSAVKKVDLSGNHLSEADAENLKDVLEENNSIKELNLSHNELREKGGEILAEGIAKNDCVRVLDLSWNHLRLSGAVAIAKSLEVNTTIEDLHLGWNGFNVRGCVALGKALEVNNTLQLLDLTCNRVTELCLSQLLRGLMANTTLKSLLLPLNPIYPSGALTLLRVVEKYELIPLSLVDLGNQSVSESFIGLKNKLVAERQIEVIHGPILRTEVDMEKIQDDLDNVAMKSIEALMLEDPLTVFFELIRLQNFRILDMFKLLDTDKSMSLSLDEFEAEMTKLQVPLTRPVLRRLLTNLDLDKNGVVDYGELCEGQKIYKQKVRDAIRDERNFDDTEIGRIGAKLREVLKKQFLMRNY